MCYCSHELKISWFLWESVLSDWIRQICHWVRGSDLPIRSLETGSESPWESEFGLSRTQPPICCHVIGMCHRVTWLHVILMRCALRLLSHELTPKCHRVAAYWYVLIATLTEWWEGHFNSLRYYNLTARIMGRLGFSLPARFTKPWPHGLVAGMCLLFACACAKSICRRFSHQEASGAGYFSRLLPAVWLFNHRPLRHGFFSWQRRFCILIGFSQSHDFAIKQNGVDWG